MKPRWLICLLLTVSVFVQFCPVDSQADTTYQHPGNNQVLLYAPGYSTPGEEQNKIYDNAVDYFSNANHYNASVTGAQNMGASVDLVKQFGDYGTIIMQTHGWWWNSSTGIGPFPGFRTGTTVFNNQWTVDSGLADEKYLSDLLFWRLAVSKKPNTVGIYHYVVFPRFVDKYVKLMPDTFMYLGYCESLRGDTMWNAFKAKGAKVAFGWDNEIQRETNVNFSSALMDKMLPDSADTKPLTAAKALAQVDENLTWDGNGELRFLTASQEWENFIFKDKQYLTITAGDDILVWNIDEDRMATDVKFNDGRLATFPAFRESISEWLAERTAISSKRLYTVDKSIGQGGNHDGFSSTCFEEGYDDRDCYDLVSFNGSGGCEKSGFDETVPSLSFDYRVIYDDSNPDKYLRTCNTLSQRETYIPFWNGRRDTLYSLLGHGSLTLIAPASGEIGVTLGASRKIHANNSYVEDVYLQISRNQSVTEATEANYTFLWEGLSGYYQNDIDVVDKVAIQDPWGINYSQTFDIYIHRYANISEGGVGTGYFDFKKPYGKHEYNLLGIYSDSLLAQVRVIRIQEIDSSCQKTNELVWSEPYWRGCLPEIEEIRTPVFNVMASVYESENMATVNPFSIGRNNVLEQQIKEMLEEDVFNIDLMFIR